MIFFSAHGVPLAYVEEAGDPYKAEMEECVDLIMEELETTKISIKEWRQPEDVFLKESNFTQKTSHLGCFCLLRYRIYIYFRMILLSLYVMYILLI
jgi:hypothetical protein